MPIECGNVCGLFIRGDLGYCDSSSVRRFCAVLNRAYKPEPESRRTGRCASMARSAELVIKMCECKHARSGKLGSMNVVSA